MSGVPTLLFLCGGRRVALLRHFRDALGPYGGRVLTTDVQAQAPASFFADATFAVPPCDDEERFCAAVAAICERERVTAVVPLNCAAVAVLPRLGELTRTTLIGGDRDAVAVATDKLRTADHFAALGIPTPPVVERPTASALPLFGRPRRAEGSRGARRVDTAAELEAARELPEVVFTRYLAGDEYTVDCYKDLTGRLRSVVPRLRLRVRAGEVERAVTRPVPELAAAVRRAVEPLRFVGPATVQAIHAGGVFHLTEINLRYAGGVTLSIAAGMTSPRWLVDELAGAPEQADAPIRWHLGMCRYDEDVYFAENGVA